LPKAFKGLARQRLSEDIGKVALRGDVVKLDSVVRNLLSHEMVPQRDVLGSIVVDRVFREMDGAHVVIEDGKRIRERSVEIRKKEAQPDGLLGSVAGRHVLGL